ncbi:kelch repeat and BTB domain-containing protein 3 [Biomphalaria pfeifferi]|uniref:Kelch repeat and BTB domain-containing protein 3 n=1 Tax=Biomphalaria pfeifferi TaxID=112525 RepID=A0AAD8B7Q3_BIOPF|nr:kelch repeat and BTB domain-containing protein 3 [Biomphalaria pfeifferi]
MESEDQIIKSNVALDIVQSLGQYLKTQNLYDAVVLVGGTEFRCHKLLLAAHCGYFRTAFETKLNENVNKYPLKEISLEVFKLIYRAMHTGCSIVTRDNVINMLKAADYLNIPFLENECIRFINRVKSSENCLEFYIAGTKYNSEKVKSMVWPIILKHFHSIHLTKHFLDLSQDDLSKLLQNENLVTKSEDYVVKAILLWVKYNTQEMKKKIRPINPIEDKGRAQTSSDEGRAQTSSDEGRAQTSPDEGRAQTSSDEPASKRRKVQSQFIRANDDMGDRTNRGNREQILVALFEHVKLFLISEKYLEKLIKHPFVQEYSHFKDFIIKALSRRVFINQRDVYWPANATHRKCSTYQHSVLFAFKKRTSSFEIKAHLIESNRWSVIPNHLSKMTTLKLATIDTSLYAFSRRPSAAQREMEGGQRSRKRSIFISKYVNGEWSEVMPLNESSKKFSVVTVDGFLYILSPFGKKFQKLDPSLRNVRNLKDLPYRKPISHVMRYADSILVFYSEPEPLIGMTNTLVFSYNTHKNMWSRLDHNLSFTASGMTSFKDELNTYVIQSCGRMWKIVKTAAGILEFDQVERLWQTDWPLHGVVVLMDELYIYGVRSPIHQNSSELKKEVQGFRKINYIYHNNCTENSTFAPFIVS